MQINRFLFLFSLIFLIGCEQSPAPSQTPEKKAGPVHLVQGIELKSQSLDRHHSFVGTVRARRHVQIHNQEEGRIAQFPWFEGDAVKKGKLLVQIDDALLAAEITKGRAVLQQSRLDLKRIQELLEKGGASADELAQAKTAVDIAVAEQRILKIRLARTRITAPFDGVITRRLAEPGDIASGHTHLLTLTDPKSLIVETRIPESVIPLLSENLSIQIVIDALGGQTFPGEILRIHPELNATTHQGTVEVGFSQQPESVLAGQFAKINFLVPTREQLFIPFSALQHDRDGAFVFVLTQGRAERTSVSTGIRVQDQIEILSGLTPGQQLITRGFIGLKPGKGVKQVKPAE